MGVPSPLVGVWARVEVDEGEEPRRANRAQRAASEASHEGDERLPVGIGEREIVRARASPLRRHGRESPHRASARVRRADSAGRCPPTLRSAGKSAIPPTRRRARRRHRRAPGPCRAGEGRCRRTPSHHRLPAWRAHDRRRSRSRRRVLRQAKASRDAPASAGCPDRRRARRKHRRKARGPNCVRFRRSGRPCSRSPPACSRRAGTGDRRSTVRGRSRRRRRSAPSASPHRPCSRSGRACCRRGRRCRRAGGRGRKSRPYRGRPGPPSPPPRPDRSVSSAARPGSGGRDPDGIARRWAERPAVERHRHVERIAGGAGGGEHDAALRQHALHRLVLQKRAIERIGMAFRVTEADHKPARGDVPFRRCGEARRERRSGMAAGTALRGEKRPEPVGRIGRGGRWHPVALEQRLAEHRRHLRVEAVAARPAVAVAAETARAARNILMPRAHSPSCRTPGVR